MFPVNSSRRANERGRFVIQNELRSTVLPLFRYDPDEPEKRPIGHGTTFRVDPWSSCITAYHVIEDTLMIGRGNLVQCKPGISLAALEMIGITLGRGRLPDDAWRPIEKLRGPIYRSAEIVGPARLANVTELVVLEIPAAERAEFGTPYLSLDLSQWRPQLGERVLAVGYADLDRDDGRGDATRAMQQYLYGSFGEIIGIEPVDVGRMRPWPLIRVTGDWPGGMSGGPVFNEAGNVVGLVSASVDGVGAATFFSGWDALSRALPHLDPQNPGRFGTFGAFDAEGNLRLTDFDRRRLADEASIQGWTDISLISFDPQTSSHVRLQLPAAESKA